MYDALHMRIREGHRTSGYSFVKLWRTKFMLLLRRNSDTLKALCCGVNYGIAISKCTGYYTRKCVSAQTTRKHKSMEIPWNSHGSKNEFIMKQEQHQRRKMKRFHRLFGGFVLGKILPKFYHKCNK